jgi:hypothetical protein
MKPRVGQRVRRTVPHDKFPSGMLGTIDVVHDNDRDFWVATDEGGFNGWTSYAQWAPVDE